MLNAQVSFLIFTVGREKLQEEQSKAQASRRNRRLTNKTESDFSNIPVRSWHFMQRVIPQWFFPYGKVRFFLVSASFIAGVYAYCRYSNSFDLYG